MKSTLKIAVNKRQEIVLVLIGILMLLWSGCAGIYKTKPAVEPQITFDELRDRVERHYLNINTLQGKTTITAQMPGLSQEASMDVYLIMPDSVALKMEAMFGIDVGTFTSNRKKFALYSPFQKVLYTGDIDSLDLSQFFQIDIQYQELMEAFVGSPKIQAGDAAPVTLKNNKYLLKTSVTEGVHYYFIDASKYVVTQYKFFDHQNQLLISKEFSRFEKYNNIYLPKVIQIAKPQQNQLFSLYYNSRKLNRPVDRKVFKIIVPKQTRHVRLGS